MTHTPGPWICDPPERFGPNNDACVWHAESGGPICYVGDAYPRGDNHPLENMRLIAAAPDMFEVLQSVLPVPADHAPSGTEGWVQCSCNEDGHEDGDCQQDLDDDAIVGIVLGDVRAALAKAEGVPVV